MRHQHLLIRRLAVLLRSRMTKAGHLAQKVTQERRGNCLPPSRGCSDECKEAQALVALTEPFMATAKPKPARPMPSLVVLKRPRQQEQRRPVQLALGEAG